MVFNESCSGVILNKREQLTNMKSLKMKFSQVVAALAIVVTGAATSHAYIVDGLLSDWGVTMFSDWTPDSATADWVGMSARVVR